MHELVCGCPKPIVKAARLRQCRAMRTAIAISTFVLLIGCLPVSTYYAEGVSVQQLDRDDIACDVQALRDAPVANQTRQSPPQYVSRRVCDAQGHCRDQGFWRPGEIYSVDVNASLRKRVKAQCMADRGYRPVDIPACPQGVAQAAPAGATEILPRLGPRSCAIRKDQGGFLIVTQG